MRPSLYNLAALTSSRRVPHAVTTRPSCLHDASLSSSRRVPLASSTSGTRPSHAWDTLFSCMIKYFLTRDKTFSHAWENHLRRIAIVVRSRPNNDCNEWQNDLPLVLKLIIPLGQLRFSAVRGPLTADQGMRSPSFHSWCLATCGSHRQSIVLAPTCWCPAGCRCILPGRTPAGSHCSRQQSRQSSSSTFPVSHTVHVLSSFLFLYLYICLQNYCKTIEIPNNFAFLLFVMHISRWLKPDRNLTEKFREYSAN